MTDGLAHLARLAGVVDHWVDASGYRHVVSDGALRAVLAGMEIPCATPAQIQHSSRKISERRRLPPALLTTWIGMPTRLGFALPNPASFQLTYEDGAVVEGQVYDAEGGRWLPPVLHSGYHQLEIGGARIGLAVAPLRACSIADLGHARPRLWGLSLDARSAPDFSALAVLARNAAGYGADALAIGTLSADDRHWLDPARIDAGQTFSAHALALVVGEPADPAVTLQRLYLEALPRDEVLLREFLRFGRDGGAALQAQARHAVLRGQYGNTVSDWPSVFADGDDEALAGYDRDHAEAIGYQVFLQWLAARGRRAAQAAAHAAGMAVGLIADLDWGALRDSSEVRREPRHHLLQLRVADPLHPDGIEASMDGAVSFDPQRLAEQGYRPWIALLRSAMTSVGAIRLLRFERWQRAWLLPLSGPEKGGAYVEQPFDDLLRLLVLESVRQRCIVVVDGVAALPDKWRAAMEQAGLLRVNAFLQQRDAQDGGWTPAVNWPSCGVAVSSSGETPTLREWWQATDIQRRVDQGRLSTLVAARELHQRDQDRASLLAHLGIERRQRTRAWPDERRDPLRAIAVRATVADQDQHDAPLIDAVIDTLGRTPSALTLVALNDLLVDFPDPSVGIGLDANAATHLLDASAVRSRLGRLDDAHRDDAACHAVVRSPDARPLW